MIFLYYVSIYVINICLTFCIDFMHCKASLGVLKGVLKRKKCIIIVVIIFLPPVSRLTENVS